MDYYQDMGDYERAEPLLRRAFEIAEKAFGEMDSRTGSILFSLGSVLNELGRSDEAEEYLRCELMISEKNQEEDFEGYLASLVNLGSILRASGKLDKVEQLLEKALIIGEKLQKGAPFLEMAELRILQNRIDEAIGLLSRCLEIHQKNLPEDDEMIQETKERLTEVYEMAGRFEEAAKMRKDISNSQVH